MPRTAAARAALVLAGALAVGVLTPPGPAASAPEGWVRVDAAQAKAQVRRDPRGDRSGTSLVPEVERLAPSSATTSTRQGALRASARRSAWDVTYTGTWSTEMRTAFQRAVDIWADVVASPVTIEVDALAKDLRDPGLLGSAGPTTFFSRPSNAYYPVALANALASEDLAPDQSDIEAEFNTSATGIWYGAGPAPSNMVDFTSIVLHELGHGLGFLGIMELLGNRGTWDPGDPTPLPAIYDVLAVHADATVAERQLIGYPRESVALGDVLRSNAVYWDGALAKAAYGGRPPRLWTPSTWHEGSSYSHLDEDDFPPGDPNSLMTPFVDDGETIRDPGPVALGMLGDMGWDVPELPGARFTPLPPQRLLDTPADASAPDGSTRLGPASFLDLVVAGRGGVPADATAVVLNVTGVGASAATDLRVYPTPASPAGDPPTGHPVPVVSNLNLSRGETRANLVTAPVGHDRRVRIRNGAGTLGLVVDVTGFYGPAGTSTYHPVAPQRLLETRPEATGGQVGYSGPRRVGAGQWLDLQVTGRAGVPPAATAVAMVVTAVDATRQTDVRVFPAPAPGADPTPPNASNLNPRPGPPVPNLVVVPVGDGGRVRLWNSAGEVALVADLAGWYDQTANGSLFHVVAPERLLDTRLTRTPRVGPGATRDVPVAGEAGVGGTATAVVLNVTGVSATRSTDVRAYPRPSTASGPPGSSVLNLGSAQTAADLVFVRVGAGGDVRLFNSAGEVALVADVSGWFAPAA